MNNTYLGLKMYVVFRFFLALLLVVCFVPASALAESARVAWDAPTTNADGSALNDLGGYRVRIGAATGAYSQTYIVS